jgi:alkanesulfonate monooxygenase SsuD/methylene tetrahydromethanopterin reductase-like flavin-dependent oxidoreductase (luciferase family)
MGRAVYNGAREGTVRSETAGKGGPAMSISWGIHVGQQNITMDELRRLWKYADNNGFGWLSVWDHLYCATNDADPHYEAIACLAALAADTKNLRCGCMVFAVPYRNLGLLAKSFMTLNHLSNGRFEPGLGAGWHEPEFRAFNIPFAPIKERMDMLDEGMQVMRSFIDNEVTDHHGRFFDFTNAYMNPRPVGRLPLWIGGRGEKRTARMAAKYADGWNIAYVSPEDLTHKIEVLHHWCEVEGRDPSQIAVATQLGFFMAASDDPKVMAATEAEMLRKVPHQDPAGQLIGNPAQVTERLKQYEAMGVKEINVAIRPPIDWAALETFVNEVMPQFR